MSGPEFSRTVRTDTIGAAPRSMTLTAEPGERSALARRFALDAVEGLTAQVTVGRADQEILASGRVTADIVQSCVVTGETISTRIDEPFAVRFRPEPAEGSEEEEVELVEDELDVMFHDGALVDVGEAVAQTLALTIDPYPRAEGADEALKEAGVMDEGEAGPFGALAALKEKLEK